MLDSRRSDGSGSVATSLLSFTDDRIPDLGEQPEQAGARAMALVEQRAYPAAGPPAWRPHRRRRRSGFRSARGHSAATAANVQQRPVIGTSPLHLVSGQHGASAKRLTERGDPVPLIGRLRLRTKKFHQIVPGIAELFGELCISFVHDAAGTQVSDERNLLKLQGLNSRGSVDQMMKEVKSQASQPGPPESRAASTPKFSPGSGISSARCMMTWCARACPTASRN